MTLRNAKNLKSFHLYRCWARWDEIQDGVQVRGRETHHILCSRPDHQGDYRDDDYDRDYRDDDDDYFDYDIVMMMMIMITIVINITFSGSLNIF